MGFKFAALVATGFAAALCAGLAGYSFVNGSPIIGGMNAMLALLNAGLFFLNITGR